MKDKDKTIEQIFSGFTPNMGADDNFMECLEKKIDAVEYIKQMQERQIKRYRYAIIASFVLGITISGCIFAFILTDTNRQPVFSFGLQSIPFIFIEDNSRILSQTGLAMIMSAGIIAIVNMWYEVATMWNFMQIKTKCHQEGYKHNQKKD